MSNSFKSTVEIERQLLKSVLMSEISTQTHLHKFIPEYFTNKERRFLRDCIKQNWLDNKNTLSKSVYEYLVNNQITESERQYYQAEWNFVSNVEPSHDIESLLSCVKRAQKQRDILSLAEEAVTLAGDGKIEDAVNKIRNGSAKLSTSEHSSKLVNLTDYKERLGIIHDKKTYPDKYLGIKTGFNKFDNLTGGLFHGELTLISALTGLGKSTFMKAIGAGVLLNNKNRNVLHVCNEEHMLQVQMKYDSLLTNIPYMDFKRAYITDEQIAKWEITMGVGLKKADRGQLFILEIPAFTDVSLIEEAIISLKNQGIIIDVVILDHLPLLKPKEAAWSEHDETGKSASDCKELARAYHCSVITATQAATVMEAKQDKGKRAGKMDVYGSKEQVHNANTSLAITKIGVDQSQVGVEAHERDTFWRVDVVKNRDGACFDFRCRHKVKVGRVIEAEKTETEAAIKEMDEDSAEVDTEKVMDNLSEIDEMLDDKKEKETKIIEKPRQLDDVVEEPSAKTSKSTKKVNLSSLKN